MVAACVFEHVRWPSYTTDKVSLDDFGDESILRLVCHFEDIFKYLGGTRIKLIRQWTRLKLHIARDENLRRLKYLELWDRMFDHYSDKCVAYHPIFLTYYGIALHIVLPHPTL